MIHDNPPGGRDSDAPGRSQDTHGLRQLALLIVIVGVLTAAAAAFLFSYPDVHDIARAAGVQAGLARFYPALPDAMLVVACAAVLALRRARWWVRLLPWLSLIAIVALVGAADAMHGMAITPPRQPTEAAVAVLPWLLLLLAFQLCLSVLRHARNDQAPPAPASPEVNEQLVTAPALAKPATAVTAAASQRADNAAVNSPAGHGQAVRGAVLTSPALANPDSPPGSPAEESPAGTSPVHTSSADTTPANTSPFRTSPGERDSAGGNAAKPSPAYTSPAYTSPAYASPAYTSTADTSPAYTSPAYTGSAVTSTATAGSAVTSTATAGSADRQAPGRPEYGGKAPGGSSPSTLRGLDLILPPYPDKPASQTASTRPWDAADQERAEPPGADRDHAGRPDERTADPGPELAIEADPAPDDPASDESHATGDEMTDDRLRLIGARRARGPLSAPVAVSPSAHGGDYDRERQPAFPAPPLSAPVPETARTERTDQPAEEGEAKSPERGPRPHATEEPAQEGAQSAGQTRTLAPQSTKPDASAPGPAQSAPCQPDGDEPGDLQVAEPAQPAAARERDIPERETPQAVACELGTDGPGALRAAEPAQPAVHEPDAPQSETRQADAHEPDGKEPEAPRPEPDQPDASEHEVAEPAEDFPRVRSSPVPPKSEREAPRRR